MPVDFMLRLQQTSFTYLEPRIKINSPLSRVALAEYLSVNRSAMIRELSKMRDDGIIDFDKDTFIVKEINKSKVPSLP